MSTHAPDTHPEPTVVVVAGNPREGSRTLAAARAAALAVAAHVGGTVTTTVDLVTVAGELFAGQRPQVDAALGALADSDVAVIATPVYKASYTGLLKAFLDLYGPDGLAGVVVVPLVVSGNPAHALVGEVHLRPVLVELGAVVPTRALTVTEADLADPTGLDRAVDAWLARGGDALRRAVGQPAADLDLAEAAR
ncbi:NAD(P)H-dependent oxidoreductase [Cellulomonas sp. CW35]|uniref:NAD(P)H-dependent oxidoreductase n=1 Tax=Cellulomonas sp. CW35 TaxID=3458249 RepID=UPI000A78DFC9